MDTSKDMYTIGIDLGGSKIAAALVDGDGKIVTALEIPTDAQDGPVAVIERMGKVAKSVQGDLPDGAILGIGVGAPGPLDQTTGIVYGPPNLPGWDNIPLREELKTKLQMPVVLDNDANVAALAEARLGAGRGHNNMVYVTVSTGIGGGVVMDGHLQRGSSGCAAEVGHHIIDINGPQCTCGNFGCLEVLASGTAIRQMAAQRLGRAMKADEVASLALQGHVVAQQILAEVYRYLGVGLINVIQMFDPSVIVLGGGVSQIGTPLFESLQYYVDRNHFRSSAAAATVRVIPAQLGTLAGVVGAALLPRE